MQRKKPAVHVVTTKRRYKDKTYSAHLLRHSYRENGRVKNETVANLSALPDEVIDLIRRQLRGERLVPPDQAFQIVRARRHGDVAAVIGKLKALGVPKLLSRSQSRERDLCVAMIAARILAPNSKLATARALDRESATSTLGDLTGLKEVSAEDLYGAMDWLLTRQHSIERALARRHLRNGTLILYDVSSSHVTGRQCPLARIGHSRDGRKGSLQIVYGLLCTAEGCPVAIEVYPGNTGDPSTLADQIAKVRHRFGLDRVVFVGDRGLLTSARIREEMRPIEGLEWIGALRSDQIRKLADEGPLQLSLFDTADLAEMTHPDFPGERLVACLNPLLRAERARKREALLAATERDLDRIAVATRRDKRALRGAAKIGERVGRVLGRHKMGKHFETTITESAFSFERKAEAIAAEARLDGIYVLRTSVPKQSLDTHQVVYAYKSLATVERAFRSLKTVDLHIRPIHHRLTDRVRAHVFLCLLACYVEWHLKRDWATLLFAEDDADDARARRASPVKPAVKSQSAQRKAATRQTDDGHPVHSFRGLLDQLATLTRNTVRSQDRAITFEQIALPTALQRKAFDLIGVKIPMSSET